MNADKLKTTFYMVWFNGSGRDKLDGLMSFGSHFVKEIHFWRDMKKFLISSLILGLSKEFSSA